MRRWASIPEWEAYSLSEIARRSHLPWVRVSLCLGASAEIPFCPAILLYFSNIVFALLLALQRALLHQCSNKAKTRQMVLHLSLLAMIVSAFTAVRARCRCGRADFGCLHSKISVLPALMYKLLKIMPHPYGHRLQEVLSHGQLVHIIMEV